MNPDFFPDKPLLGVSLENALTDISALLQKIVTTEKGLAGKEMPDTTRIELATLHQELVIQTKTMGKNWKEQLSNIVGELKQKDPTESWRYETNKNGIVTHIKIRELFQAAGFEIKFGTPEQDVLQKVDLIANVDGKTFFCQIKTGGKILQVIKNDADMTNYVVMETKSLQDALNKNPNNKDYYNRKLNALGKAMQDWSILESAARSGGALPIYLFVPEKIGPITEEMALQLKNALTS